MALVEARFVVCLLGTWKSFDAVATAVNHAVAPGFTVDAEHSHLSPDERMGRAFDASKDRVLPSFHEGDDQAVAGHESVAYVLSPHIDPSSAFDVAARVLAVISAAFEVGATAVKVDSSCITHGRQRWLALATGARKAQGDPQELAPILREAFVRRPILDSEDGVYYTCGMHLLGRRDVELSEDVPAIVSVALLDAAAERVLAAPPRSDLEGAALAVDDLDMQLTDGGDGERYEIDDFLYNPHGYYAVVPAGTLDDDA